MFLYKTLIFCAILPFIIAFKPVRVQLDEEYPYLVMIALDPWASVEKNATKNVTTTTTTKAPKKATTTKPQKKSNQKGSKASNSTNSTDSLDVRKYYVGCGTIINIRWVLTLAHKIGSDEYIRRDMIVLGGGVSQFSKYLTDTPIYFVARKEFKPGYSPGVVFHKDNLCLLQTAEPIMDAQAAFMSWVPKMSKGYPAKVVENIYWVAEQEYYQKYKMAWLPYSETPDNKLLCNYFIELVHICLTTTLSENPRDANKGERFPCDHNISLSDGGPIIMDNQFHGLFIGLENGNNDVCEESPDEDMWKDKYQYVGIRSLNIDNPDEAYNDIGSTFIWMKETINKEVKSNPINFFRKGPQLTGNRSRVGKLYRLPTLKPDFLNRSWRCEMNKFEEFYYHKYLISFIMFLLLSLN